MGRMTARVHRSPGIVQSRKAQAATGPRAPSSGAIAALFASLGVVVYFATVLFAIGDGGLAELADQNAGRVTLTVAGALSMVGAFLGLAGLRAAGRGRGAAFVGLSLGIAFAGFAAWSVYRSF